MTFRGVTNIGIALGTEPTVTSTLWIEYHYTVAVLASDGVVFNQLTTTRPLVHDDLTSATTYSVVKDLNLLNFAHDNLYTCGGMMNKVTITLPAVTAAVVIVKVTRRSAVRVIEVVSGVLILGTMAFLPVVDQGAPESAAAV